MQEVESVSLVPDANGAMWNGAGDVTHIDRNDRIRHLCGVPDAWRVSSLARDARGRLWFAYRQRFKPAGVGYADARLNVHLFSVPAPERKAGVRVFAGPDRRAWLEGTASHRDAVLYRTGRAPTSKPVCRGLRKHATSAAASKRRPTTAARARRPARHAS
jgi:hypothetical protein